MPIVDTNEGLEPSGAAVTLETSQESPIVVATIDPFTKQYKWFKPPKEPKLTERKPGKRKIKLKDGTIKEIERKGHKQVFNLEIKRCVKAIETREARIAAAEKALADAKTPLTKEKAQERLEVSILRRDYTIKRLDMLLDFAKDHNLKTIDKRRPEKAKNIQMSKIVLDAASDIRHIVKVKNDIILTAAIKAQGSRSHVAFEKIVKDYTWVVTKFSRPGKTPLESDDAVSRGIQGLWDAAMRFDATYSKDSPTNTGERRHAIFTTVAHNWVMRNTRARTRADAKPGQIKIDGKLRNIVSIDDHSGGDDDEGMEFAGASVESSVDADSVKFDVAEALSSLDKHHQEILKLRHFNNMSYEDIARTVRMPVNLVKQLTSEAHKLLQSKLGGYDK